MTELWYEKYKVNWLPAGECGEWRIEKFTVDKRDETITLINFMQHGRGHVPQGEYTRLIHADTGKLNGPMMSDTPEEIRDHLHFIRQTKGRVLIHGLGIGMCALAAARKPEVKSVLVIEKSLDVISLVAKHLRTQHCGKKIEIREGDAFTWKPQKGERWNTVWHDIWPSLCATNLSEMATLHRRFGRRCDWQGSWGKELLQERRQRYA